MPPLMIKQQLEIALHTKYLHAVDSLRLDLDLELDEPAENPSSTTSKIQVINMEDEYRCVVMTTFIVY